MDFSIFLWLFRDFFPFLPWPWPPHRAFHQALIPAAQSPRPPPPLPSPSAARKPRPTVRPRKRRSAEGPRPKGLGNPWGFPGTDVFFVV